MHQPSIASLMTREVISAHPRTPCRELAQLMRRRGVSAVPIVEDGRVVGVVSGSDALASYEAVAARPAILAGREEKQRWRRARGRTARDVMTTPEGVIRVDTSANVAAGEMLRSGAHRLFVVDARGALVGVLSRRDLLKAFVRDDETLLAEIRDEVFGSSTSLDPTTVDFSVRDGVLVVQGLLQRRDDVMFTALFARTTSGTPDPYCAVAPRREVRRPHQSGVFG